MRLLRKHLLNPRNNRIKSPVYFVIDLFSYSRRITDLLRISRFMKKVFDKK